MFESKQERSNLRILGILVSVIALWNGICDLIYVYSAELSGKEHFSSKLLDVIATSGDRGHKMVMLAQTAGWLYPIYGLSYYHWYKGMGPRGWWPCVLLYYAVVMIGGVQHAGWAYLSVLFQAKSAVGCTDDQFFDTAQRYIIEHFVVSDLTAVITLQVGLIWNFCVIASGKTYYPRWFVFFSPLGITVLIGIVGFFLPKGIAGFVIVPFGTWLLFFPTLASTIYLWNAPVKKKEV